MLRRLAFQADDRACRVPDDLSCSLDTRKLLWTEISRPGSFAKAITHLE